MLGTDGATEIHWRASKDRTIADQVRIEIAEMLERLQCAERCPANTRTMRMARRCRRHRGAVSDAEVTDLDTPYQLHERFDLPFEF